MYSHSSWMCLNNWEHVQMQSSCAMTPPKILWPALVQYDSTSVQHDSSSMQFASSSDPSPSNSVLALETQLQCIQMALQQTVSKVNLLERESTFMKKAIEITCKESEGMGSGIQCLMSVINRMSSIHDADIPNVGIRVGGKLYIERKVGHTIYGGKLVIQILLQL